MLCLWIWEIYNMQNIRGRMCDVSSGIKIRLKVCIPLVDNKLHNYVKFIIFNNVNENIKWNTLWLIKNNLQDAKYKR
jgi:hypothetical protein